MVSYKVFGKAWTVISSCLSKALQHHKNLYFCILFYEIQVCSFVLKEWRQFKQ